MDVDVDEAEAEDAGASEAERGKAPCRSRSQEVPEPEPDISVREEIPEQVRQVRAKNKKKNRRDVFSVHVFLNAICCFLLYYLMASI